MLILPPYQCFLYFLATWLWFFAAYLVIKEVIKLKVCKHEFEWNDYCGAYVCVKCGQHSNDSKGRMLLDRCFCGWSTSGKYEPLEDDIDV